VAHATGETVAEIAHLGFSPLAPVPFEREPLVLDWDEVYLKRNVPVFDRPPRRVCA
jgi:hypothetical protein